MADNKRSFLLYADVHFTVKQLTDEQAGKLFKIILSYVNDENPEVDDLLIRVAFEPIKQALKRDLRKYELIREKRSLAGKASADKRQQVSTSVEHDEQVSTHSTVNVSDNVNVSVIDNDSDKDIKELNIPFEYFWQLYDKKEDKIKCEKKWNKLTDKDREDCIFYLPAYIQATPDKQFRKHPYTYLHNRSWENEIIKHGADKKTGVSDTELAELMARKHGIDAPGRI